MNACGNRDYPVLGLTVCLRDTIAHHPAKKMAAEYRTTYMREIKILREQHTEMKSIRYLCS